MFIFKYMSRICELFANISIPCNNIKTEKNIRWILVVSIIIVASIIISIIIIVYYVVEIKPKYSTTISLIITTTIKSTQK